MFPHFRSDENCPRVADICFSSENNIPRLSVKCKAAWHFCAENGKKPAEANFCRSCLCSFTVRCPAASARAARRGEKTALPWQHGRHTAAAISRRRRAEQRWRPELPDTGRTAPGRAGAPRAHSSSGSVMSMAASGAMSPRWYCRRQTACRYAHSPASMSVTAPMMHTLRSAARRASADGAPSSSSVSSTLSASASRCSVSTSGRERPVSLN